MGQRTAVYGGHKYRLVRRPCVEILRYEALFFGGREISDNVLSFATVFWRAVTVDGSCLEEAGGTRISEPW